MREEIKKKKEWLIHYSADDYWQSNPHSRHHITHELNRHYPVLWVNPIGSRMPSLKKKGTKAKIIRKLKSLLKLLKKVDDGFYVTTFVTIPYFKKGWLQKVNYLLLFLQLRWITVRLRIKNPLLFYTAPVFANTLSMIKYKFALYYYSDQYSEFREFDQPTKEYTELLDRKLYNNVDLIMCASQKIYDNVVAKTDTKVVYFPHQVDFNYFQKSDEPSRPDDLKGIEKPIVGYYGTLSDSNDWDILEYSIKNRPKYNFVFIGRKDIEDTGLEKYENVHFLGKKPFEEIPHYGNLFDVGIMFWIRREWIINCSPLKLKEYLSMGIPVVSTEIEELNAHYSEIVYIAKDKVQFLAYLDETINNPDRLRTQKGIDKVRDDSWYNAVNIFHDELGRKERI